MARGRGIPRDAKWTRFYGKQNELLFRRAAPFPDERALDALAKELNKRDDTRLALRDLVVTKGCPLAPLIYRIYVVARVSSETPPKHTPGRHGGLTSKEVRLAAAAANSLAAKLDDVATRLFDTPAVLYAADRRLRGRLTELALSLRACSRDLRDESASRVSQPAVEWEPSRWFLYLSGLCDFVKEHTGSEPYESIGVLVEATVAALDSHRGSPSRQATNKKRGPRRSRFSGESIKKDVFRFRDRLKRAHIKST